MKKLLFLSVFASACAFGQSKDLTKKQAQENFNISKNRIILEIHTSKFEFNYQEAKCVKKNFNIPLKDMPIFQIEKNDIIDSMIPDQRFWQVMYGLGDTLFPERMNNGKKTPCGLRTFKN